MSEALPIAEYCLTAHAQFEMERRQISEAEIARVLSSPEQTEMVRPGRAVFQSRVELSIDNRRKWSQRTAPAEWRSIGEKNHPRFDPAQEAHRELAALGWTCAQKVTDWIESGGPGDVRSVGKLRSMVREMLAEELGQIDEWVEGTMRSPIWTRSSPL